MFSAVEDQIEFREASGAPRVLRGTITGETETTVILTRRDGEFEIPKSRITKTIRRTAEARAVQLAATTWKAVIVAAKNEAGR
ncbi:MAG TPA: hypothetical protein VEO18_06000 [Thermoplasmata archaeon]|nr:hypothetical protein [Thermoplasmata archaeon]